LCASEGNFLEDDEARAALNERLRAFAALAGRYGRDASGLVTETIRSWDSATTVSKLEQNVGRDLRMLPSAKGAQQRSRAH
jgi:uncharacterized membrane-anchored protein YjiN (DUF445 family)